MIDRLTRLNRVVRFSLATLCVSMLLGSGMAIAKIASRPATSVPESASAAAVSTSSAHAAARPNPAPPDPASAIAALKNLDFRNIGPAVMGGRIDCFAVDEDNPDTFFVGTAAGGIWKTTNGGITFMPIFDHEVTSSIGALAIAPSDHQVLWVGTGEANNRQSASWGAGVYRSLDGGRTFQHVGLEETQAIGRIVVDPHDPNTAYVAALGGLWNANPERGVFKTTDGGKSWNHVLAINDDTGVVDLAIDPAGRMLYAAAYERRRTVFGFNGGGPSGGIYKSDDSGAHWRRITNGLPYADGSEVGRIGISVYAKNPAILYARVQSLHGGIYRSDDYGDTWAKMGDTDPRPSYFGVMAIDPQNDLRLWVPGAPLNFSQDGGKTFATDRGNGVHSDYHGFWIDPHDSNHMMVGVDGGIYISHDMGRSWEHDNIIAIGQFYEVTANNAKPYMVCGGLQDNGSWCGPSFNLHGGISNADWVDVSGGDGFYNKLDPVDSNIDYAESQDGSLSRRNMLTGESKSIRPREAVGEAPFRFQWRSPIEISAFDHKTVYYGGNFLFKSTDQGDHWEKLGPDLTNNEDRRKMAILGKLPERSELSREDGVEWWPCITVIGESPMNAQVIYVGTDDGNLQVTRDGGKNWANVASRVPGLPKGTYVSRVIGSKFNEGTAYAAFNGHRMGDFHIYIYRTTDYGQSWHPINTGITEQDGTVEVVREDPKVANLLYAGTERGLFVSFDTGANWTRLRLNLPTVPVDDIFIHPRDNDMILGTHGRSIWILDDITPIQELAKGVAGDVQLFNIRPTYMYRAAGGRGGGGFGFGSHEFEGPNPQDGAYINFYYKNEPTARDRVTLTVSDAGGKTVRVINCNGPRGAGGEGGLEVPPELAAQGVTPQIAAQFFGGGGTCALHQGVNRVVWDFRMDPPISAQEQLTNAGRGGGFGGGGRGPMVDPGSFTVKLTMGDTNQTASVKLDEDPRVEISDADRTKRREAITKAYDLTREMNREQREIVGLKTALDQYKAIWARPNAEGGAAGAPTAAAEPGGGGGRGGRGGGGGGGRGAGGGAAAQGGGPGAGGANAAVAATIPDNVRKAVEDLSKQVDEIAYKFINPPEPPGGEQGGAGPALEYRPPTLPARLGQAYGGVQSVTAGPTADDLAELDYVSKQLADVTPQIQKLVTQDLPALNKQINDSNVPRIVIPPNAGGGGGRRGGEDGSQQ